MSTGIREMVEFLSVTSWKKYPLFLSQKNLDSQIKCECSETYESHVFSDPERQIGSKFQHDLQSTEGGSEKLFSEIQP